MRSHGFQATVFSELKRSVNVRLVLAAIVFVTVPSFASGSSIDISEHLGDVIASADACGIEIDQGAVTGFIEKNVSASDMEFAGNLAAHVYATKQSIQDMSDVEKLVWCTQTRRVAKAYRLSK